MTEFPIPLLSTHSEHESFFVLTREISSAPGRHLDRSGCGGAADPEHRGSLCGRSRVWRCFLLQSWARKDLHPTYRSTRRGGDAVYGRAFLVRCLHAFPLHAPDRALPLAQSAPGWDRRSLGGAPDHARSSHDRIARAAGGIPNRLHREMAPRLELADPEGSPSPFPDDGLQGKEGPHGDGRASGSLEAGVLTADPGWTDRGRIRRVLRNRCAELAALLLHRERPHGRHTQ